MHRAAATESGSRQRLPQPNRSGLITGKFGPADAEMELESESEFESAWELESED